MEKQYILTTGEKGEAQLDALDRTFGVATRQFLRQLQIEQRRKIADIGCGSGNVTLWMAEQVAPYQGQVIGVDESEEQIRVARRRAQERGIQNVAFILRSAYDLSSLPRDFDLVYCRWLLIHLPDLQKALKQMTELVDVNGLLVCEESVIGSRISYPRYDCIHKVFAWIGKMLGAKGCDIDIGLHLFHRMQDFPAFKTQMQFNQIVITETEEIKDFLQRIKVLLASVKPALLQFDFVNEQEIDAQFQEIDSARPGVGDFIAHDRMTQLWSVRQY